MSQNYLAPATGTCAAWMWYSSACPPTAGRAAELPSPLDSEAAPDCSTASTCSDCALIPGCGFCPTTSTCVAGSWLGPADGATCPSWMWSSTSCLAAPPSADVYCASLSSCLECTNARGCGFCPTTGTCQYGTWLGPAKSVCPTWKWSAAQCTMDSAIPVSKVSRSFETVDNGSSPATAVPSSRSLTPITAIPISLPYDTQEYVGAYLKAAQVPLSAIFKRSPTGDEFKAEYVYIHDPLSFLLPTLITPVSAISPLAVHHSAHGSHSRARSR